MTILKPAMLLSDVAKRVNVGKASDVDYFMSYLNDDASTQAVKLADFAISQIRSEEGIEQIKHYLFKGTKIQRNYAALYFKRHGYHDLLIEAVLQNCIQEKLAFSR